MSGRTGMTRAPWAFLAGDPRSAQADPGDGQSPSQHAADNERQRRATREQSCKQCLAKQSQTLSRRVTQSQPTASVPHARSSRQVLALPPPGTTSVSRVWALVKCSPCMGQRCRPQGPSEAAASSLESLVKAQRCSKAIIISTCARALLPASPPGRKKRPSPKRYTTPGTNPASRRLGPPSKPTCTRLRPCTQFPHSWPGRPICPLTPNTSSTARDPWQPALRTPPPRAPSAPCCPARAAPPTTARPPTSPARPRRQSRAACPPRTARAGPAGCRSPQTRPARTTTTTTTTTTASITRAAQSALCRCPAFRPPPHAQSSARSPSSAVARHSPAGRGSSCPACSRARCRWRCRAPCSGRRWRCCAGCPARAPSRCPAGRPAARRPLLLHSAPAAAAPAAAAAVGAWRRARQLPRSERRWPRRPQPSPRRCRSNSGGPAHTHAE